MSAQPAGDTHNGAPPPPQPPAADASGVAWLRLTVVVLLVLASLAVALDLDSPLRAFVTIAFLVFAPGLALAELLHLRDPVEQLAIAVGASLAIDTLVAVALFYLELYSYELAFAIVAAITLAALVAGVLRSMLGPDAGERPRGHAAT